MVYTTRQSRNTSVLAKLFRVFSRKDLIDYIREHRAEWTGRPGPSNRTTPFTNPLNVIEVRLKAAGFLQGPRKCRGIPPTGRPLGGLAGDGGAV
jgi:hypothetical protein